MNRNTKIILIISSVIIIILSIIASIYGMIKINNMKKKNTNYVDSDYYDLSGSKSKLKRPDYEIKSKQCLNKCMCKSMDFTPKESIYLDYIKNNYPYCACVNNKTGEIFTCIDQNGDYIQLK